MKKKKQYNQFAVLGLGRFGMSILQTLAEHDVTVLACDRDEFKLQTAANYATHVVQADMTDENALIKLGLGNFDVVILAMGEDFEASQIATMIAKESGVKHIIVKAVSKRQKKILESIGADEVILPELEMGARLARRLVNSNIMDILEESDIYTITEMHPLDEWINKTIRQADIRHNHNLTVMAVRRNNKLIIPAPLDRVINKDDIMIVLSEKK